MNTRHMVFHHPLPLNPGARGASGIRPVRMSEAFESIGYTVWPVTGLAGERGAAVRRLKRAVAEGVRFDFCYSESSTMPMTMTEPHHLPLHPFLDRGLFRYLRSVGVPVGHFLRDIFWRFPEYREAVPSPKREAALAAYRWDLHTLRHHVDCVFLPSEQMAKYLDLGRARVAALPPGHGQADAIPGPDEGLRLFYVGGIGAHYRLEGLFDGVARAAAEGVDVSMTVCTGEEMWRSEQRTYSAFESPAIRVVHAQAPDLRAHFEAANVGALYVEPDPYWGFAVPVKLYEYLGSGKPILAAAGSLTGEFVSNQGVGWSVEYRPDALAATLRRLANNPREITGRRDRVLQVRGEHTWAHRAHEVALALAGKTGSAVSR